MAERLKLSSPEKYIVIRKEKLTNGIRIIKNDITRMNLQSHHQQYKDYQKQINSMQYELNELIEFCNDNGLQELLSEDY